MGLGGFGGAGPEGPPKVTEGAGQAPPPTGCLRPYSFVHARSFSSRARPISSPLPLLIGCLVRDANLRIRRCIPYDVGLWPSLLWVQQSRHKPTLVWSHTHSQIRSPQMPKRQRTTRSNSRYSALLLSSHFFRRSSFYFLRCGGLERHAAKPHLTTSTTSSRFRAAFQRRRPEA